MSQGVLARIVGSRSSISGITHNRCANFQHRKNQKRVEFKTL